MDCENHGTSGGTHRGRLDVSRLEFLGFLRASNERRVCYRFAFFIPLEKASVKRCQFNEQRNTRINKLANPRRTNR